MEIGNNIKVQELKADIALFTDRLGKLFIEKGELFKSGYVIKSKYILKIGKHQLERYRIYYEIQKMRRKIAIYQAAINRDEVITEEEVEKLIEKDIKEYEDELKRLTLEYNVAMEIENAERVTKEEYRQIKSLYRNIVKRIHPDLNPDLDQDLVYLWQETQEAYNNNDLEKLIDIKDILDNNDIVVNNVNEIDKLNDLKIKLQRRIYEEKLRIREMKEMFPYNKISLLNDDEMIAEVVKEIQTDIEKFKQIYNELEVRLDFVKDPQRGVS